MVSRRDYLVGIGVLLLAAPVQGLAQNEANPPSQARITNLDEKIELLKAAKVTAIARLRGTFFCSLCGRSQREIEEQESVAFAEHLKRTSARAVPPSEQALAVLATEYDERIAGLERERDVLAREGRSPSMKAP